MSTFPPPRPTGFADLFAVDPLSQDGARRAEDVARALQFLVDLWNRLKALEQAGQISIPTYAHLSGAIFVAAGALFIEQGHAMVGLMASAGGVHLLGAC